MRCDSGIPSQVIRFSTEQPPLSSRSSGPAESGRGGFKGPLAGSAQTEAGSRPSGTLRSRTPTDYLGPHSRARGGPLEDHSDRVEAQLSLVIYWRALALDAEAFPAR